MKALRKIVYFSKLRLWLLLAVSLCFSLTFPRASARQVSQPLPTQEFINQRVAEIIEQALQRGVVTSGGVRVTPGRADASLQEMDEIKSFGERAIAPLSTFLDSSNYRAQQLAVRMLAHIGGKSVIVPLTKAAEHSPSEMVRLSALLCLGQQPWEDVAGTVKRAFTNDPDSLVRKQAKQMIDAHESQK